VCLGQGGQPLQAHKVGQIIARGDRRWLIRVYLGRNRETNKRNYHNRTIHGPMREAPTYLTRKLRERDPGRDLEGAKITLNEYLDRWLEAAVKPRCERKLIKTIKACCGDTSAPLWLENPGGIASSGSPGCVSTDDGPWLVSAHGSLHPRGIEGGHAPGAPLRPIQIYCSHAGHIRRPREKGRHC